MKNSVRGESALKSLTMVSLFWNLRAKKSFQDVSRDDQGTWHLQGLDDFRSLKNFSDFFVEEACIPLLHSLDGDRRFDASKWMKSGILASLRTPAELTSLASSRILIMFMQCFAD